MAILDSERLIDSTITYSNDFIRIYLNAEFPNLVSYNRFVELSSTVLVPLCFFLRQRSGHCIGPALPVCHNRRIGRYRVFKELAARGKTSMGSFNGFKLHLLVNDRGGLRTFCLTEGNVDDRYSVPDMTRYLFGKLFAGVSYLSQPLFEQLLGQGLQLITPIRSNMKNKLMPPMDKLLLRKQFIIETITDQSINISQTSHSRHRSIKNFVINLLAGLIAYTHQPKKPSLNLVKKSGSCFLL